MKQFIFALVALLFSCATFAQTDSTETAIAMVNTNEMSFEITPVIEKDTTFSVEEYLDCGEDMCLLEMLPMEWEPIAYAGDRSELKLRIELMFMDTMNIQFSNLENTPEMNIEFVGSISDSTIAITETDQGFVAVNRNEDLTKYSKLFFPKILIIDSVLYPIDSLKAKNFLDSLLIDDDYVFSSDSCSVSNFFISGYSDEEENLLVARWAERGKLIKEKEKVIDSEPVRPEPYHYYVSDQAEALASFVLASVPMQDDNDSSGGGSQSSQSQLGFGFFLQHAGPAILIILLAIAFGLLEKRRRKPKLPVKKSALMIFIGKRFSVGVREHQMN